MPRLKLTIALLMLVFSSSGATAGVIVLSTQTRLASHQSIPVTAYIETDRFKLTLPDLTIIYRADLDRLWAADLNRQVYYELTPESMRQFGGVAAQLSAAQAQLQDTLSQLPPDQRAQIEALLGSFATPQRAGAAARPVFARQGGSKTVAGYNCDLYRKMLGGQQQAEFCVSPAVSAGFDPVDFRVMDRFSEFAAPLMSSHLVPHLDDMDWGGMDQALGFSAIPLDVVAYDRGKPDIEQTVTKLERATIPAAAFELPPGLSKQDLSAIH